MPIYFADFVKLFKTHHFLLLKTTSRYDFPESEDIETPVENHQTGEVLFVKTAFEDLINPAGENFRQVEYLDLVRCLKGDEDIVKFENLSEIHLVRIENLFP